MGRIASDEACPLMSLLLQVTAHRYDLLKLNAWYSARFFFSIMQPDADFGRFTLLLSGQIHGDHSFSNLRQRDSKTSCQIKGILPPLGTHNRLP